MKAGNTDSYSDLELALLVLQGCYGNGSARQKALGARYTKVQKLVEYILATGRVPDGSGADPEQILSRSGADPEQIRKAVTSVFSNIINEVSNEVIKKL